MYRIVLKKGYNYSINNNKAYIDYNTKSNLLLLLNYFEDFCKENDLNWDNVELLGTLQYIGICTLYKDFHEGKYGEFLFLLGKYLLTKKLNNEKSRNFMFSVDRSLRSRQLFLTATSGVPGKFLKVT